MLVAGVLVVLGVADAVWWWCRVLGAGMLMVLGAGSATCWVLMVLSC